MAQTLKEHLKELNVEKGLASILLDIAAVEKRIYDSIDLRNMVKKGSTNTSGDTQSSLDTQSEKMIAQMLDQNEHVCSHLSEECEALRTCKASGTYFVSYDPYDGGTVGDANITVGSIFGVWNQPPVMGEAAGKGIVCGAYALWGARLSLTFATREHGAHTYEHDGSEFHYRGPLDFGTTIKQRPIFAPSEPTSSTFQGLFNYCVKAGMRLRYVGAMVTDAHHVLMRGGCFWFPSSEKRPGGHLRLMYECVPLGFMIIAAGGSAITETGASVLDTVITDWHQKVPIMFVSPVFAKEACELFKVS